MTVRPLTLRAQLPSLERLDLWLEPPGDMRESEVLEMEYSGQVPLPHGLTELGLAAGPMYGRLLRNLQLPPGLKVGNPTSLKDTCCCCTSSTLRSRPHSAYRKLCACLSFVPVELDNKQLCRSLQHKSMF